MDTCSASAKRLALIAGAAIVLAGCAWQAEVAVDAAVATDVAARDSAVTVPDGTGAEPDVVAPPDAPRADDGVLDTNTSDTASTPDAHVPDASVPDVIVVDAAVTDVAAQDGGATGPCPATQPHGGASCNRDGLVCEYDNGARRGCRPTAVCSDGSWQLSLPPCSTPPPETCPATRDAAAGRACTAMNAECTYAGLQCTCTNCSTGGPVDFCSGDPTWHCEAPNADPACPAAIPLLGAPCAREAQSCRYACGSGNGRVCNGGAWYSADGGPCPVSSRRAKHDIAYLDAREVDGLAQAVAHTRLATYEYDDAALAGRRHLGFVIEDQPASYAVDPERNQVDLYGYTSMLVAAVQAQQRRIDALEREVHALRLHDRGRAHAPR